MTSEPARSCPSCGKPLKVVPILYGYPTEEAFERARQRELKLGGCMVWPDQPEDACAACGESVAVVKR